MTVLSNMLQVGRVLDSRLEPSMRLCYLGGRVVCFGVDAVHFLQEKVSVLERVEVALLLPGKQHCNDRGEVGGASATVCCPAEQEV